MKITIKAAFLDTIERLEFRRKELEKVKYKCKNIEKDLQELSKEELINILNSTNEYYFSDNHIYYKIPLTKKEKEKEKVSINQGISYDISRLKKWSDASSEDKQQILTYLNHYNIFINSINC